MNVILRLMLLLICATSPLNELRAVGQTKHDQPISIEELRNAPASVVINNRTLNFSAYAWRDFAPGNSGPNGSAMMVGLKVTSADKQTLPSGIRMDRAWILFGEQVWEVSNLRGPTAAQDDKDSWIGCSNVPECQVTVRNGPKWGPGVYVDVVVRLTDNEGQHYFLQAKQQKVIATA